MLTPSEPRPDAQPHSYSVTFAEDANLIGFLHQTDDGTWGYMLCERHAPNNPGITDLIIADDGWTLATRDEAVTLLARHAARYHKDAALRACAIIRNIADEYIAGRGDALTIGRIQEACARVFTREQGGK